MPNLRQKVEVSMKVDIVYRDYYQERRENKLQSAVIVLVCIILAGVILLVSSCMQPIPAGV
jgi:hypothetical protein